MAQMRMRPFRVATFSAVLTLVASGLGFVNSPNPARAAVKTTANFRVRADSDDVAERVALRAESFRKEIAHDWLGRELLDWKHRCQIVVQEQADGGSGWISYSDKTEPRHGMEITVRGEVPRILETYLPHEITHAVLMTALDRPLPRWIDEGIAMMSESEAEKRRLQLIGEELARSGHFPSTSSIFTLSVYPIDRRELTAFYLACFSLTQFLEEQGGKSRLFDLVADARRDGWESAVKRHYQFSNLDALESAWRRWMTQDSREGQLAEADSNE